MIHEYTCPDLQEERLDRTEEFLRAVVFRPSTQRLNVVVDSLSVGLVDDRYGHHIKVLAARLQVCFTASREQTSLCALQQSMLHFPALSLLTEERTHESCLADCSGR